MERGRSRGRERTRNNKREAKEEKGCRGKEREGKERKGTQKGQVHTLNLSDFWNTERGLTLESVDIAIWPG